MLTRETTSQPSSYTSWRRTPTLQLKRSVLSRNNDAARFKQRLRPTRTATPPRDARDLRCGNCGEKGHDSRSCTKPKNEMNDRACLKRGKPGHRASQCRSSTVAAVKQPKSQDAVAMCVVDGGFVERQPKRPRIPTPTGTTMGEIPAIALKKIKPKAETNIGNKFKLIVEEHEAPV